MAWFKSRADRFTERWRLLKNYSFYLTNKEHLYDLINKLVEDVAYFRKRYSDMSVFNNQLDDIIRRFGTLRQIAADNSFQPGKLIQIIAKSPKQDLIVNMFFKDQAMDLFFNIWRYVRVFVQLKSREEREVYDGVETLFNLCRDKKYIPAYTPFLIARLENSSERTLTLILGILIEENDYRWAARVDALLENMVPNVKIKAMDYLFRANYRESIPKIRKIMVADSDGGVKGEAHAILDAWGLKVPHRLYVGQEPSFFDKTRSIIREDLEKTGSRTVLLGGKLTGEVIIRIISKTALDQWLRALDAKEKWRKAGFRDYIPVEPIIEKDGQRRIYEVHDRDGEPTGQFRVFTKVLGPSIYNLWHYTKEHKISNQKYYALREQVSRIEQVLRSLSIEHSHLHGGNFCVDLDKMQVYIIDFDAASPR
jgi:hypothetical protein